MAGKWQEKQLSELIDVIGGGTPNTTISEYWGGRIPWLSVQDISLGCRWVSTSAKTITDKGLSESTATLLDKGDIIISARGTVGVVAQLLRPMAFNQSCYGIRGKKGIAETDFIYYLLLYTVSQMKRVAHGGVFDTITRDTFKIIRVLYPPLEEQRTIAHILGTLDDKIELNRRMSETLEAMARALFKSWFVDFDPVRAKMDGRWHKGESLPGLPAHLYDLFPDRLVDSELGEIPEGWEVGMLGDVAEHPRRGVQPEQLTPDTPYIALEHMPKQCIALSEWGTAFGLESNKFKFKKGEILFGKLRPYFHKVGVAPIEGICSTDIVVVAPRSIQWFGFVLGHISSVEFVEYTDGGSTGTKMPRTSWADMTRYPVVLPHESVAAALTERVRPAVNRIISFIHESRTLAALRDALLPKLISGELQLKDTNRII